MKRDMFIIPAIDLIDGKVVRLEKGDYSKKTIYDLSPLEQAKKFEKEGATQLHVVDLDGAKCGELKNFEAILNIVENTELKIEVGGGIRDMNTLEMLLNSGVEIVILGTSAIKNIEFIKEAVQKYGNRIAIGIDAKNGLVRTEGWKIESNIKAKNLAKKMIRLGVKTIIYTDINKDGMLEGPNLIELKLMAKLKKLNAIQWLFARFFSNITISLYKKLFKSIFIISSGGISKLDDLKAVRDAGADAVIIGKALYSGDINLKEAICSLKE